MKICKKCGRSSDDAKKFCPMCGEKLPDVENIAAVCPSCGLKNEEMLPFCAECGADLRGANTVAAVVIPEKKDVPKPKHEALFPDERSEEENKSDDNPKEKKKTRTGVIFDDDDDVLDLLAFPKGDATEDEDEDEKEPEESEGPVGEAFVPSDNVPVEEDEDIDNPASRRVIASLTSLPFLFGTLLTTLGTVILIMLCVNEMIGLPTWSVTLANYTNSLLSRYGLAFEFTLNGQLVAFAAALLLIPSFIGCIALWNAYFTARGDNPNVSLLKFAAILTLVVASLVYVALLSFSVYLTMVQPATVNFVIYLIGGASAVYILIGLFYGRTLKVINSLIKALNKGRRSKTSRVYIAIVLILTAMMSIAAAVLRNEIIFTLAMVRIAVANISFTFATLSHSKKSGD